MTADIILLLGSGRFSCEPRGRTHQLIIRVSHSPFNNGVSCTLRKFLTFHSTTKFLVLYENFPLNSTTTVSCTVLYVFINYSCVTIIYFVCLLSPNGAQFPLTQLMPSLHIVCCFLHFSLCPSHINGIIVHLSQCLCCLSQSMHSSNNSGVNSEDFRR